MERGGRGDANVFMSCKRAFCCLQILDFLKNGDAAQFKSHPRHIGDLSTTSDMNTDDAPFNLPFFWRDVVETSVETLGMLDLDR